MDQNQEKTAYKKSPWRWACLALAAFSGLCLAYGGLRSLFLVLFNKVNNASTIGIIGGADGPTAIFVTSKVRESGLPPEAIYVLLLIMGIIGFLALRKIEKK